MISNLYYLIKIQVPIIIEDHNSVMYAHADLNETVLVYYFSIIVCIRRKNLHGLEIKKGHALLTDFSISGMAKAISGPKAGGVVA